MDFADFTLFETLLYCLPVWFVVGWALKYAHFAVFVIRYAHFAVLVVIIVVKRRRFSVSI